MKQFLKFFQKYVQSPHLCCFLIIMRLCQKLNTNRISIWFTILTNVKFSWTMNKLLFCYFDNCIVFNAVFLQDRDSFSLWSVNWLTSHDFLRKTVVWFPVALHSFKYRVFLLLNWLILKAREPSLPCYLTSSRKEKKRIHVFYKGIVKKYTQKTKLELELGMQISLSLLIIIILTQSSEMFFFFFLFFFCSYSFKLFY